MINRLWNLLARCKGQQPAQVEVDPGVQAIARTFYEKDRWQPDPKSTMLGVSAFRDRETDLVVFVQTLPDMPGGDPDISAEWIPYSDWNAREYLDKEWKRAYTQRLERARREKELCAEIKFNEAKQKYLGE